MAKDFDNRAVEAAWDELAGQMQAMGRTISAEAGTSNELAEGYRFLTRTIGSGFEMLIEKADAKRPEFKRVTTPYEKVFGDNPDTFYDRVTLDPGLSYRVTGNRGQLPYMAFCVYGGGVKGMTIVSNIFQDEMVFEESGDFELIISAERPIDAPNWLKTDATSRLLIIRQYFLDKAKPNQATYSITSLETFPAPEPLQPGNIVNQIRAVARYARFVVDTTVEFSAILAEKPNEITVDSRNGEGVLNFFPTSDNDYYIGWYKLNEGEALMVEGLPPECLYWSLTLYNRWFESYDYRYRDVFRNNSHITLESDGTYRLVVAEHDPGLKNWIDTEGHAEGMLCFRWLSHRGTVEEPKLTVAKTEDLEGNKGFSGPGWNKATKQ